MSELIHPNGSYTARQVAQLVFKKSYVWFFRHKKALTDHDGFPAPISRFGIPRWAGATLLLWMQTPRVADDTKGGTAPDLTNVLDLRTARMLRERKVAGGRRG